MKKIKIIGLIVLVLICIFIVFASCKKTKALEPSIYRGQGYNLTLTDSNSGGCFYYLPTNNTSSMDLLFIDYSTPAETGYMIIYKNNSNIGMYFNNGTGMTAFSKSFTGNSSRICYFYIILGSTTIDNDVKLCINYGYKYYTGTGFVDDTAYYYFDNIPGQSYQSINDAYATSTGLYIQPYYNSSDTFRGYTDGYIFDVLDYSDAFSEAVPDIKYDYLSYAESSILSNLYQYGYQVGYQAGYNDGYDQAYSDYYMPRYNQGYNAGYNDGVNDNQTAYNHGYDDGAADGYRDGMIAGLTQGYNDGYNDGVADGMAGATPMSQATTLVGSIFTAIGSILSIQLFPGFSLGLLILVPLFFSVLGLILWIWRRN